ncbi:MAG: DNA polymerase III subunit delta [Candidatus Cloacimonadales bacterium]
MPSSKKVYKHHEFLAAFKKSNPQPIYFIHGEEYFLREKTLARLSKAFSTPGTEDFDLIMLYAETNAAAEAVEHLEMKPFMAKHKLVIVRDFHKFNTESKNLLAEYCSDPAEQSILILVAEKIDRRKKAEKQILQNAISIECKKPYNSQDIKYWLRTELQQRQKQMSASAIDLFCNSLDPDYMLASNELEKLIIFSRDAKTIDEAAVLTCIHNSKTNKIFDLQNALGKKDLNQSIVILENMLENNEAGVYVVIMLTRYFCTLWKIQALKKRRLSESEIAAKHLNEIFYSFRSDYLRQARNFKIGQLREIFQLLLQVDIDLKSLNIQEKYILEILIYKICK